MAGLVLGIRVAPRGATPAPASDPRRIRLLVRSKPNMYGTHPGYAYVLGGTPEASDSAPLPRKSPTLVLEKDQPVAITVVNRSEEPAAVHWHGIELESFPDGVPGWSGQRPGAPWLPALAPPHSLTVRFTPPRAGTFMYHSHFDEFEQIASGLYGPIIVTAPGQRFDGETDRVLLFSDAGPTTNVVRGPFPPALLNGSARPAPLDLRAGITYRFRLINIRTDYTVALALLDHGKPARWRLAAKDGADLPATQATVLTGTAHLRAGRDLRRRVHPACRGTAHAAVRPAAAATDRTADQRRGARAVTETTPSFLQFSDSDLPFVPGLRRPRVSRLVHAASDSLTTAGDPSMRHLILVGLLAGATMACQDSAAPREPASPALSEASEAAQLDLREERASLVAAGNALSSALAHPGRRRRPRRRLRRRRAVPFAARQHAVGAAATGTFLTGDPLAPSALQWSVEIAEVSNDGTQGYTWSEGSSTYDFGTGARAAELLPDLLAPRRGGRGLDGGRPGHQPRRPLGRVRSPPASARPTPSTAATSPTPM